MIEKGIRVGYWMVNCSIWVSWVELKGEAEVMEFSCLETK